MCIHFPSKTLYKVTLAAITNYQKLVHNLNTTEVYLSLIESPKQLFLLGRLLSSSDGGPPALAT